MMKTNDYVKYVTETFISNANNNNRKKRQKKSKRSKDELLFKWFGIVPFIFRKNK